MHPVLIPLPGRSAQAGAATVTVVALLMLGLAMTVAYLSRSTLVDLAGSANDVRAAQAFELAEAGLAWSLAHANLPVRVDATCSPLPMAATPPGPPDDVIDDFLGRLGLHGSPAPSEPGQAHCRAPAPAEPMTSWSCRCPAASPGSAAGGAPGFTVVLSRSPTQERLAVSAWGCNTPGPTCLDARRSEGLAELRQVLRRMPLFEVPALAAVLPEPGGAPVTMGFEALFGMTPDTFSRLPHVARVECADDCVARIDAHWRAGYRVVQVAGDLLVDAPLAVGSTGRPVVLAITGRLQVDAALTVVGLLHAGELAPVESGPAPVIRGAVVAAAPGSAPWPEFHPEADLLAQLARDAGPWLAEPGSWHEP